MTDARCGCCAGTEVVTPRSTENRPGLSALSYRIGTHPDFLRSMIARLTSHALESGERPLQRLTTRAADDPAIALLDAWATLAHVLAFYQERIAHEGYLRTATERRSILELGRLVGYRLRPGVAASTYLAFTLQDGFEIELPAGTLARSLPEPGQNAEPFETAEPLKARAAWNAIRARQSQPFLLVPQIGCSGTRTLYLAGTAAQLAPNDTLLAVRGEDAIPYVVRSVELDEARGVTRVQYADRSVASVQRAATADPAGRGTAGGPARLGPIGRTESERSSGLSQLVPVVAALRVPPSAPPESRFQLARSPQRTFAAGADLGPQLLAEFAPELRQSIFAAYANTPTSGVTSQDAFAIEAMRVKAALFGASVPLEVLPPVSGEPLLRREWPLAEIRSTLTFEARLNDGPLKTLTEAFQTRAEPSSGAPISLVVSVRGAMSGVQRIGLTLGQLEPEAQMRAPELWVAHVRTCELPECAKVTIEAVYAAGDGGGPLVELRAIYQSPTQTREVRLTLPAPIGLAAAGESAPQKASMNVHANGLVALDVRAGEERLLLAESGRQVAVHFDASGRSLSVTQDEVHFAATDEALRTLSLDGVYEGIVPGGRIALDRPHSGIEIYRVADVRTAVRAAYGISQRVTMLLLDRAWLSESDRSLAVLRGITVYAQNESLPFGAEPIAENVEGAQLELDGLYEGLEAGRWIVVKGERADVLNVDGEAVPGIEASELAMIAGTEHALRETKPPGEGASVPLPGDQLHTRLLLSEPLAYRYRRDSVQIAANVVRATHGETTPETLGSSDGITGFQRFALVRSPLTQLAAADPDGVQSTLEVRVNAIRWPERETLLALGPRDRGYEVDIDDDGVARVTFGDGEHGALPPSGSENVTAVYRVGIGRPGNVKAGQISTLSIRPLGVKEVVNPLRASGGADPETRDEARERVPLAVQALDRLVSVEDYAHFSRIFAGIGKAHATRISDGTQALVHLTIAGSADAPIDEQSDLYRHLLGALVELGDPSLPLQVALREAIFVFLGARVKVLPEYLWENVEPKLRAALLEAFGFERRALGQSLLLSEVVAVMQSVEGVDYVDVDLLEGVAESAAASPTVLAETLNAFAGRAPGERPKQRLAVRLAQFAADVSQGVLPAQVAYLRSALPDSLILTEVQP
jgi:predicted phage baseplate assembly protein